MRKIIRIVAGELTDLMPFDIDLTKHNIKRIWTIYDQEQMWTWCKFDSQTGKPVRFTNLEDLPLRHREGIFLEDYIHDWNIRQGNLLDYYSRVTGRFDEVDILVEYDEICK